jgi:hypothetical protein
VSVSNATSLTPHDCQLSSMTGKPPPPWPYVYSFTRVFLDGGDKAKAPGTAALLTVSLGNEQAKFEPRRYAGTFE